MKIKKILLGSILLAATFTLAACGNSSSAKKTQLQKIKDKGTLVVALSPDYPPFEFQTIQNGKNEVVGSDVDLAKAIGKELDVKVVISSMDFNNVLTALSSGKADIAISGISATPEREKSYDFSKIYYNATNEVVIKKSDLNKYKSFDDLKNAKVAAQKGSIQEGIVLDNMKSATEIALPAIGDEINEVKAGKVQAAVIEDLIAKSYVSENPDLALAKIKVPNPKNNYGTAIALPKGSSALKKKVNAVITKLLKNGEISKQIQTNYKLSEKVK
ncbi:transporter substrate-binding domain-containing protein [Lactococcus nasutitermitis]|uniref:Transporter substrate-binding domain-containing protein n=1 Tax=Lactococcus nasutitermitis TaxID=1652957 RepID=A0ABV9JAU0_9LACT|nr:transporter substrate-binding domain-containing protein [Lactococcus nasutitermitis]